MNYLCPVCGFNDLPNPPTDFEICPSCGTEFENDNYDNSLIKLRKNWINNGMNWWSIYERKPENWDPIKQVQIIILNRSSSPKSNTIDLSEDLNHLCSNLYLKENYQNILGNNIEILDQKFMKIYSSSASNNKVVEIKKEIEESICGKVNTSSGMREALVFV